MKKIVVHISLWFFSLLVITTKAQSPSFSSSQILEGFQKLQINGSVLYIAAHPDDENTRLLTWMVHEKKVRTAYLSLTRGEGGQNLIGSEQGEQLGIIRTQELLAARKVDGAEQFFTRAYDFGYSKSADETLKLWNKDSVLSDVVLAIRKFRPDIIITRFPTTGEGGHGHHTASAILASEAFKAAADPTRFPEQLKSLKIWQAKRIVWNTFNFGSTNTTSENQFKIETGLYNSLLGISYGELAALSRSQHRCQGMGTAADRSPKTEYFKLLDGEPIVNDLFDNVDLSWNRYQKGKNIDALLESLIKEFDPMKSENSIQKLGDIYAAVGDINDEVWKNYTQDKIKELILVCSGTYIEAVAIPANVQNGDSASIILQLLERKPSKLKCIGYVYPTDSNSKNSADYTIHDGINSINGVFKDTIKLEIPKRVPLTTPYYLKEERQGNVYAMTNQSLIGFPEARSPLTIRWIFTWGTDQSFMINTPIQYKWVDPSFGEKRKPLVVTPPVSMKFNSLCYVVKDANTRNATVEVEAYKDAIQGLLTLNLPKGWHSIPEAYKVTLNAKGNKENYTFRLSSGVSPMRDQVLDLTANLKINAINYSDQVIKINYDHIPEQVVTKPALAKVVYAPIKLKPLHVAYLEGAGDEVSEAIAELGCNLILINENDLKDSTNWKNWDAVVTGIRFFNTNENSKNILPNLLKYANQGGVLLIQYNTEQQLKVSNLGPYPLPLSRARVTDENATVSILNENDAFMNFPNKIKTSDFEGWIQERGLYFPGKIDSNYIKLLSMNDPGEEPLNTSLIYANYGKGKYIYTSLSFFRELPAAVPGAYRLFANLIAGGKKD